MTDNELLRDAAEILHETTGAALGELSLEQVERNLTLCERLKEAAGEQAPEYDVPEAGDVLYDADSKYGNPEFHVLSDGAVGTAGEVEIQDGTFTVSVADYNECNPDIPVVVGEYLGGGDKQYHMPVTRLRRE